MGEDAVSEAFKILGVPEKGGIIVVADHASNFVPQDVNLGIAMEFLDDHIAYDIGTAAIAEHMVTHSSCLAILGGASRLVADLNRYPVERSVIPQISDGVEISGNALSDEDRAARLDRFYHPYHDRLKRLIAELEPALLLSLHSFTPVLRTDHDAKRPWQIGVLYNDYETASKLAVQFLEEESLIVGDQKPYSGKELNATMNRQAETTGTPYFGIEIRQDLISHPDGQQRFGDILLRTCDKIRTGLAPAG